MSEPAERASDSGERSGGCLCGAARYVVAGEPLRVGLCHCTDCKRTSGSAYAAFAVWPRSAYQGTGKLGTFKGRSFCPMCGSRVVSLRDDEAEIMVGSLDTAPSDLIPSYELWTPRREGWLHNLPWADQYEADRSDEPRNWRQARRAHQDG
ncbi:aldehyde-activating protein [Mesorhizobium sp. WSM3859]|nr:GFA family protein [Mesorhizobium sp. WSM3859]PBC09662.1 aldehyde-activating protein [Mesorhizobium sp. WSM3859]